MWTPRLKTKQSTENSFSQTNFPFISGNKYIVSVLLHEDIREGK